MANIMESFASGAQAVAAPEQARASIQAAQLQQQFMPESMRLDLVQKQQATSEQSMKLSMLADSIKADKEIAPKLQEFIAKNPGATESETDSELSKIYIKMGRPKEAIAFSAAASKAKHEETLSKLDEYKLADEKMDAGRFAIMNLDPSDPSKWNQGLLDYTTKTPGANRGPIDAMVAKNIAAGMSEEQARQSAQATLVPLMKTSKQALADRVAAIKEKQEADSAKRIELQNNVLIARIQGQQATLALGYAREDRMNKQETNKEAKEADDKRTKERLLFDDQRKSFESLHTKYLKARGLATSSDDKIALDETYQQDLESKNSEFRNEFTRLGIPYTEMATPHTAAAKPVGDANIKAMVERSGVVYDPAYEYKQIAGKWKRNKKGT